MWSRLWAAGLPERWKIMSLRFDKNLNPNLEEDNRTKPITMEHIAVALIFWCAGIAIGFAAFLVELIKLNGIRDFECI